MEKIYEGEYRFLSILWENEPIASPKLVQLCNEQLGWKKSTTYTVIKKLIDKGIVKNENTIVSALVTKEEVDRQDSEELLQRTSKGNIPAFFAAFLKDRKLSREDADKIRQMIDQMED
ncbi:MAG: BlaI/MecI/CopY family transcriptional regulator [Lachnospiraceae bacterium]|nr:BlaI/MecI/CopY family transcriptional regulator [Butyrivibrio sp.]MCM1343043.1 BlaI/MecI/CopY family transcriptional regulator [Muribaculaceae bacterium]MCM1410364.1 BlaI/MecI/CopY family transcriptional regulator [Lachnospiraceae bacterium]